MFSVLVFSNTVLYFCMRPAARTTLFWRRRVFKKWLFCKRTILPFPSIQLQNPKTKFQQFTCKRTQKNSIYSLEVTRHRAKQISPLKIKKVMSKSKTESQAMIFFVELFFVEKQHKIYENQNNHETYALFHDTEMMQTYGKSLRRDFE